MTLLGQVGIWTLASQVLALDSEHYTTPASRFWGSILTLLAYLVLTVQAIWKGVLDFRWVLDCCSVSFKRVFICCILLNSFIFAFQLVFPHCANLFYLQCCMNTVFWWNVAQKYIKGCLPCPWTPPAPTSLSRALAGKVLRLNPFTHAKKVLDPCSTETLLSGPFTCCLFLSHYEFQWNI